MGRAVAGEPAVVRVEAGLLVVGVAVVAQHHADARVDDLSGHAVAVLGGHAGLWVPAAAVQVVEPRAQQLDLLRLLAGGRDRAEYDRLLHPVDDEALTEALAEVDQSRRPVAPRGIDVVDVAVGRLGDVRVRRENCHDGSGWAPRTRRPGVAPVDSPSRAISTPLTKVCTYPVDCWSRRFPPAGRSNTIRGRPIPRCSK